MAVDLYALCPCGSGKKLKFCCGDLAVDIEKIQQLISGDQPRAALSHIDKLLAKDPKRASLLDIKATLELSMEDFDAASQTIQEYLTAHPKNPSAHAQASILAASLEHPETAVDHLQDALELVDRDLSERVFEAIGAVGHSLLVEGDIVAARAHLQFFAAVSPEGDNRAIELLLRLNLQGGLPLMLRDQLRLAPAPKDAAYKRGFDEAVRLAERGLWRRAEAEFAKLLDRNKPQPPVVYNLALVRGWLGKKQLFVEGMRQYSKLEVPENDAVEAESLAQLVEQRQDATPLESVRITFPIQDEDLATERLLGDRRLERYELDPESFDEDEVTRPRNTFLLLDRPAPRTGAGLAIEDAPNVLAFLSLYGKRTDRDARLEVTTDRGHTLEQVEKLIGEVLGDAVGSAEQTDVVGVKRAAEEALSWRWRLPDDTPPIHRRELLSQRRKKAILEDWPAASQAALGGLSPNEAAPWPNSRIPLLATILIVEQAAADLNERADFDELRTKLGLPREEKIDPTAVDLDRLSLVRIPQLDAAKLSDEQLLRLFNRTTMSGAGVAGLMLAQAIASRPSLASQSDGAYRQLIRGTPNPDQALAWARQAQEKAMERGASAAEWRLLELEVQIERGDPQGVQTVLGDLRTHHLNEPGVAEAMYRLLYSAGLIQPRPLDPTAAAAMRQQPMATPSTPAAPASGSKIWTPGQESASPTGAKQAIWTP